MDSIPNSFLNSSFYEVGSLNMSLPSSVVTSSILDSRISEMEEVDDSVSKLFKQKFNFVELIEIIFLKPNLFFIRHGKLLC